MADRTLDWRGDLGRWLKPFLGSPGPQGAATDVSALRVGSDRSRRSQDIQPMAKQDRQLPDPWYR
jgi:hypothetical protein